MSGCLREEVRKAEAVAHVVDPMFDRWLAQYFRTKGHFPPWDEQVEKMAALTTSAQAMCYLPPGR